ncbi:MAG: ribosome small subunit-dependent GTPase A [Clostridia bacterium]|nr:ribosome small subunit-dependent GTPase A [Clostridia bacterium]
MNEKKTGRIILSRKGFFNVENGGGITVCKAATKLRLQGKEPLCGDIAAFTENGDGTGFIVDILPRKCCFPRPSVANADVLCIVFAVCDPAPDLFCIDLLTCIGVKNGIETAVIVNKCDLADCSAYAKIYSSCGFRVFTTDKNGMDADNLRGYLRGRTAVFAGASGVGKSSLLNRLYPEFSAETGELSAKIKRGRNTTRHVELFPTGDGGYIADTPGFSALDPENADLPPLKELAEVFPEFAGYKGECRFRGCGHTKEIGCAVIEAVEKGIIPASRHESYVKMFDTLKNLPQY